MLKPKKMLKSLENNNPQIMYTHYNVKKSSLSGGECTSGKVSDCWLKVLSFYYVLNSQMDSVRLDSSTLSQFCLANEWVLRKDKLMHIFVWLSLANVWDLGLGLGFGRTRITFRKHTLKKHCQCLSFFLSWITIKISKHVVHMFIVQDIFLFQATKKKKAETFAFIVKAYNR